MKTHDKIMQYLASADTTPILDPASMARAIGCPPSSVRAAYTILADRGVITYDTTIGAWMLAPPGDRKTKTNPPTTAPVEHPNPPEYGQVKGRACNDPACAGYYGGPCTDCE